MHYSVSKVKSLEPRQYKILLEWYGPPEFWDPDPQKYDWDTFYQYLDMLDYPMEYTVGELNGKNTTPGLRHPNE